MKTQNNIKNALENNMKPPSPPTPLKKKKETKMSLGNELGYLNFRYQARFKEQKF